MIFNERDLVLPWAMLVLLCFFPLACSKPDTKVKVYPVRGKVFFNGQPAGGAVIHFHPKFDTKSGTAAFADVKEDGSFRLSTFGSDDGAAAGDYIVTIGWSDEKKVDGETVTSPDRMGERYSKRGASTLKATVNTGENVVPRFDLR